MDTARLQETIIALSTPPGFGGLGVVRLSGRDSLAVARKIFKPKKKEQPFAPRAVVLGCLVDSSKSETLDEAYLTYFPGPKSYTREDMVEISCHGSPAILEEAVRLCVVAGATAALPGEFTLRAFLNGRMDILQAEAVQSLIRSTTLDQARISFKQLQGGLSDRISSLRGLIVELISLIEARIEFPDEDLSLPEQKIKGILQASGAMVSSLVSSYETGRRIQEGIRVVIAGRANVGKSTLFNALLESERAIVTPYPGTTRDFLTERIQIKGIRFSLTDMAGLTKPSDPVEKEGVERSWVQAEEADGILVIMDASQKESNEDTALVTKFAGKKRIILFNKIDLSRQIDVKKIISHAPNTAYLEISALRKINMGKLKELMIDAFLPREGEMEEVVLHLRQKLLLEDIGQALASALDKLEGKYLDEMLAEDARRALRLIGQLTGEITSDEVLDKIFGNFCVGK